MSESNEVRAADEHGPRDHAAGAALTRDAGAASLELQRAVRALRALSACNQALVHASCETDLLNSICRVIVGHAGYRLAWVGYVMNDAAKSVRPVAHVGFEDGYLERAKITWAESERGRGPTGTAIRTKRPKICRQMITDPDFAPWREEALRRGFASSIVLPLMDRDEVFGALNIYAAEPDAFSDEEAALLGEMANDMAYGLLSLNAKDALRESEEMYRDVFVHASDALMILEQRPDGLFEPVGLNPSAIAIHGDIAPDVPDSVAAVWRHCAATGEPGHYEESRRTAERGLREFSCVVLPIARRLPKGNRLLIISRDVTERKLEELRNHMARTELENVVAQRTHDWQESERRFRDVFESAPIAIWIEDWSAIIAELGAHQAKGTGPADDEKKWNDRVRRLAETRTIVDANPGALEMFGCRDLGEIIGKTRSAFGLPGDAEDTAELRAFVEGRTVFRSELGFAGKSGCPMHGWIGITFPPRDGGTRFTLVTIVDITARKRMEEALHRSEEHYRRLFETMVQGVVYQDSAGRVISMNPAAERILGRSREDLTGRTSVDEESRTVREDGSAFPGLEHPAMIAINTGREVRDVVMGIQNPKDGRRHWIQVNAIPLYESGAVSPSQVYTIFDDISGRIEANRKIARQATVLTGINRILRETLGESSDEDDATVFLEVVCELTSAAMAFVAELGSDGRLNAVALNRIAWEKCELPPEALERMRNLEPRSYWARALRSGRTEIVNDPASDPEAAGLPPGHVGVKRFMGVPLMDGARMAGLIGLANKPLPFDADDQRVVETTAPAFMEALKRKRAQRAVAKLNGDLAVRARALEQANTELESFSYSVSHDLRAPLRGIEGFGTILADDYGAKLGQEGVECVQHLRNASRRMGELIDDLLKLSRASRAELHAAPANLTEIAESIALDLRRQDPARVVEWGIQPGLVAVGDARLLRAALENLLGNAWKFTSKQPAARIEFGAENQGAERVYFVRDNGAGFDMAYAERLFAPFRRLHSTTEFPGTGVGLATVQRIIRRHEGRIWAEGHVGQGAVFRFTLGIAPAS